MKVTLTTPDRLVIEDRPWFLWISLYGLSATFFFAALTGRTGGAVITLVVLLLGAGALAVGWHFAPFQRFTFDRPSNTFTHAIRRPSGAQIWERPLSEIRRAADEGHWSDGSRMERVTLLTEDGPHPLESGFSGQSRAHVIKAINDWLGGV